MNKKPRDLDSAEKLKQALGSKTCELDHSACLRWEVGEHKLRGDNSTPFRGRPVGAV